jgi:hypothetical protein
MLQEARIQEIALDAARTDLAPLRVEDVTVEPMADWTGQEALDVMVVVPASAVRKLRGEAMLQFTRSLRKRLEAEGDLRYPFIHYATPEDLVADAYSES